MKEKYNIGLDIGTTSVGWAVTNADNMNILKTRKMKDVKNIINGTNNKTVKALWGVYLFDSANTAEKTRTYRGTRRRYDRRRERIYLLQEIFSNEIKKKDEAFFYKMKESFYKNSDTDRKKHKLSKNDKNNIFNKYETIYHLRNALITKKEKFDIRLIYLAIHHIIKKRGNFIHEGDNFNIKDINITKQLNEIFNTDNEVISQEQIRELAKALLNNSKNEKQKSIEKITSEILENKPAKEFAKLMIGYSTNLSTLFSLEEKNIKISFSSTNYDEDLEKIENNLEENKEILESYKELYNNVFIKLLFKGKENTSISSLMIDRYNNHQKDLKFLKELVKNDRNGYEKILKNKKASDDIKKSSLYEQYLHKNINFEEFYKSLKKEINNLKCITEEEKKRALEYINKRADEEEFLPIINDTNNGIFPYQLNEYELKKIIENQGKYYKFLNENEEKITKLLNFRIPYYVGPLSKTTENKDINNRNAWLKKIKGKEKNKITPFNFEEIVDVEKSAEEFIKRMISKCTYITNEYALPNDSILYSKFKVVNELKNIKICLDNTKISVRNYPELFETIYNDFFLDDYYGKKTTSKNLEKFLKEKNILPQANNIIITGFSTDQNKGKNNSFNSNMISYLDFFGERGIFENTKYTESDAEQIIQWKTIFDDNKIMKKKLEETYSDLSQEAINKVLSKKYKGWGTLSKKLLIDLKDKKTLKSIMDLMMDTSENFMQIINNEKYNFQELISKENINIKDSKLSYNLVKDLVTSPSTKKGIYQSLLVVNEIVKFMGHDPENIMIEMARENNNNKAVKNKRKEKLKKSYQKNKEKILLIGDYDKLISELNSKDNKEINKEKIYLYFLQAGKCLYSGNPLDLTRINDYHVDHIIPQSLIKDDSIDNKALVLPDLNESKKDKLTLDTGIINAQIKFWKQLKDLGLMSTKKFNNLTRKSFNENDIKGFINRQLVETRQITKHVGSILKTLYPKSNIEYVKAGLSSGFRQKYEMYKYRDLNDLHHAHDAYLAIAIGKYQKYFKSNYDRIREKFAEILSNKNLHKFNYKYGYVVNTIDENIVLSNNKTGEIIFDLKEFINTVTNNLYRFDMLINKKKEIYTGKFYNETIKSGKGKISDSAIPLKKDLPLEYGYYISANCSYMTFVRYNTKNKEKTILVGIPYYIDLMNKKDKSSKNNYIKKIIKNENFEIIKDKIPFHSVIYYKEFFCALTSISKDGAEIKNIKPFKIDKNNQIKWKETLNRCLNGKMKYYINTSEKILNEAIYSKQLEEIILYIIGKIKKEYKMYSKLPNRIEEIFKIKDNFDLSNEQKETLIKQLLTILKYEGSCVNLITPEIVSETNGKPNYKTISDIGRIKKQKIDDLIIINKSITGIYEDIIK